MYTTSSKRPGFGGLVACLVVLAVVLTLVPVGPHIARSASSRIGAASRADLPHARDHVVVEIAPGANPSRVLGRGAEPVLGRWHTHPVPADKTPLEMVRALLNRPGVVTAELDYQVRLEPQPAQALVASSEASPVNDPFYPYQWHFPAVRADQAWSIGAGDGVVVAILDSGVSKGGVDLDCHTFVAPYNAITQTAGAAAANDDNGHGTHVAGTVAQCTNNGVGVAGVAFDASLMPVKVLNQDGVGSFSNLARGIDWARAHGADVISMSLGCDGCTSSMVNDAIEAAHADGVVLVAASGNANKSAVTYPGNHPDVIAVGATEYDNTRAPYSNRGSALDVVAPGGNTSKDDNGDGYGDGVLQETFVGTDWGYWFFQGTSMAAPHVAGAAAVLLSELPCLSSGKVQQTLQNTALDLGPSGFDTSYGHGLIQIHDALLSLASDEAAPTWPGSARLLASDVTGTSVELTWDQADDDTCIDAYRIYRDGNLVETVGASRTSATISGLKPATEYTFMIRAVDKAGNLSQPLSARVSTLDTIPPKWGKNAGISVLVYGETSLRLGWDAASDNVAVTGYRLRMDGKTVSTLTGRQLTVGGLQPGAGHRFEVLARDQAGNWSVSLEGVASTAIAFEDTTGHTFYDDILWMSGSGVTRGCNPPVNDLFCPDDAVTRGQMAAFLVRALGLKTNTHPGFEDVPSDSLFAQDIAKLATAGITRGCNPPVNDRFCPNDPVTRAQMAAFLVRALGLTADDHAGFDDVPADSIFAFDIAKLATAGITRGCNPPVNDLFCPGDPVTRGALAAFLRRALG